MRDHEMGENEFGIADPCNVAKFIQFIKLAFNMILDRILNLCSVFLGE